MWKFIVDVVHDFVSSLQPDVGRGFLHVSNVFLYYIAVFTWCNQGFMTWPLGDLAVILDYRRTS